MHYLSLIFLAIGLPFFVQSQPQSGEWMEFGINGISYNLPPNWYSDNFSSSSVCDCQGTIDGNKKISMVIYPSLNTDTANTQREYIWDHHFEAEAGSEIVKIGKKSFRKTKGKLTGRENEIAWRYTPVSGKTRGKYTHIIYFFGKEEEMKTHANQISQILDSVKWKRK